MVYTLYLNISGDESKENNTKFYILTGIACTPQTAQAFSNDARGLLWKHFQNEMNLQEQKTWSHDALHSFYSLDKTNNKNYVKDFFNLILSYDVKILAYILNKKEHWKSIHPRDPSSLTVINMMNLYQRFLEKNKDIGFVVSSEKSQDLTRALLKQFELFRECACFEREGYPGVGSIMDTVLLSTEDVCCLLEAAKLCSKVIFDKYEYGDAKLFKRLMRKFDPEGVYVIPVKTLTTWTVGYFTREPPANELVWNEFSLNVKRFEYSKKF